MDQMDRGLITQVAQLNTREEFLVWEQRWDNFIESLEVLNAHNYRSVLNNR